MPEAFANQIKLMPTTPHRVSQKIDSILDNLNCKWDLQLRRLHGLEPRDAPNDPIPRRCLMHIRYLCWHHESRVISCIADFEDQARNALLRYNDGQSRSATSLRSSDLSPSFMRRDQISNVGGITAEQRKALLSILFGILNGEVLLARDSKNYQRTAGPELLHTDPKSFTTNVDTLRPRTPSPTKGRPNGEEIVTTATSPQKRRKMLSEVHPTEKNQTLKPGQTGVQQNLLKYFQTSKKVDEVPATEKDASLLSTFMDETSDALSRATKSFTSKVPTANTSFTTADSSQPVAFSQASSHSSYSSVDFADVTKSQVEVCQDYFPTQDAVEYFADESFTSELHAAETQTSSTDFTFDLIRERTPFKPTPGLPKDLAFWLCWELCRVSQSTNLAIELLAPAAVASGGTKQISYDEFWRRITNICKEHSKSMPERSDIKLWMESSNGYQSPKGRTASFTFQLDYAEQRGPQLWKLKLHAIRVDQGSRMHRKFGSDKHVVGSLNFFDKTTLPKWIQQQKGFDADDAFQKISHWLATDTHHLAGRTWRGFYLETAQKKKDHLPNLKINLFAVAGTGLVPSAFKPVSHAPISIEQLIDWHIPPKENTESTDLKLFSRFGLALSKTRSTIILEPCQFRHLPDVEPVMNDGCALMSLTMAKAVWEICGDGSAAIPTAFQARIGGAKGVWVVDYRSADYLRSADTVWIQVSDSQLKVKPHPKDWHDADEIQRCFEVLKWSKTCVPGHLNTQFINILADRGVPRSVLRKIVQDDIETYIEAARGSMQDPRLLQAWLLKYHTSDRSEEPVDFKDGLPNAKEDDMNFLVQCGFSAENNEHVRNGIRYLMNQKLNNYVDKLRIEVPYSTTALCIPDPYQVLGEDEVYMGFSHPWEISETGVSETVLTDIDILVARNPAALASDIQKRRAVYKHALRHFRDVIVFPTRGTVPLASLLSGGDYDGDMVTVIWHPQLVKSFHNVEKPDLPSASTCGLGEESRKVSEVFKNPIPSAVEVDEFLTSCFRFNARPNRLGICTAEHEKLIYNGVLLSDPGAVLLAALAGYLVDANKQGLSLADDSWYQVSRAAQAGRKLDDLAYKNGKDLPRRFHDDCINIMDYLKFDVAMKRKDDVLIEFEKLLPNAGSYDPDLSSPYKREFTRASNPADVHSKHIASTLNHLKTQLTAAHDVWVATPKQREKKWVEKGEFAGVIQVISGMVKAIEPPDLNCDIFADFQREDCSALITTTSGGSSVRNYMKGTRWSLLRASAMYFLFNKDITWWTVGDELGRIKARTLGPTRELTPAMHHILKADAKLIKWLFGKTTDMLIDDSED